MSELETAAIRRQCRCFLVCERSWSNVELFTFQTEASYSRPLTARLGKNARRLGRVHRYLCYCFLFHCRLLIRASAEERDYVRHMF